MKPNKVFRVLAVVFMLMMLSLSDSKGELTITLPEDPPDEETPGSAIVAQPDKPKKNPPLRLALALSDGSQISGVPDVSSFAIQTTFSKIDIPLKRIKNMKFQEDHKTVSIEFLNGDKLTGVLVSGPIKITTTFGKVSIKIEFIKSITMRIRK